MGNFTADVESVVRIVYFRILSEPRSNRLKYTFQYFISVQHNSDDDFLLLCIIFYGTLEEGL